ncbi:VOC family protein [Alginatibacterium sediminis]|uniref:VOC family protein n=1 Tax=Alginatibacterium sediminis TaxID=2164068 RepID=A0A420E7N1_9ALTE|nr:VOC family protein [Alginatibacterium sediminis]RKF14504.1 VOC family protein [Alginatibacterium sediminis]
MIRLEHLNIVVTDLEASLAFYQAIFPHWQVRGRGESSWFGKNRQWLHFGDDYNYLTLNDNGDSEARDRSGHQIGIAHSAYVTDDIEGVIARLASAGFSPSNDGQPDEYRRNIYFIDPAGLEVEFVQYYSDQPKLRNRYDN